MLTKKSFANVFEHSWSTDGVGTGDTKSKIQFQEINEKPHFSMLKAHTEGTDHTHNLVMYISWSEAYPEENLMKIQV